MRTVWLLCSAILISIVATACNDHDQFRDDVIVCEETDAHLSSCCGRRFGLECKYSYDAPKAWFCLSNNCDSGHEVDPDVLAETGRCLLSRSCEALSVFCDGSLSPAKVGCR